MGTRIILWWGFFSLQVLRDISTSDVVFYKLAETTFFSVTYLGL